MTFKHNDRVTCEIKGKFISDARISIDSNGTSFICQNEMDGDQAENLLGYRYSWRIIKDFKHRDITNLKLAQEKSLEHPETLEVGDVIEFVNKNKREIRAIIGSIIFTRDLFEDKSVSTTDFYEIEDLVTWGWKIKPTEEPLEVTQAQVEEKFGRKVKIIK